MSPRRARLPKERPLRSDAVESAWRLFVAVPLPEEVTRLVGDLVRDLAAEDWPVRWVAANTAHITLQFIGETPPERAELLRMALAAPVAKQASFNLRTADLGVFPNQKRPRVIWLGLYGPAHRLESLQRDIGETLREMDVELDDKPFHPHITLGRVRDQATRGLPEAIKQRFAAEAESGRATAASPLPVPVREVLLMRSFLSSAGARHETVARYPLASPSPRS